MPASTAAPRPSVSATPPARSPLDWALTHPLESACVAVMAVFVLCYYGFVPLFTGGTLSMYAWAWSAWNPETNYEHGVFIYPACLFLVWRLRESLTRLSGHFSPAGLAPLLLGILLFLLSARTLQPRMAMLSLPLLLFGAIWALRGWSSARLLVFPVLILPLFAIQITGVDQATFWLQFAVTKCVSVILTFLGLQVEANGTSLVGRAGQFSYEVAGGCSGMRSLMAMTMLTALYIYFTQKSLWKSLLIFALSIPFAIIGNIGRVTSIMLFAWFIDRDIATGIYHDYSAFIFFPVALAAMIGSSKLINHLFPDPKNALAFADMGENSPAKSANASPTKFTRPVFLAVTALVAAGLASVHLVPRDVSIREASISLELPDFIGPWYGETQPISKKELEVLAKDTHFSRKLYSNGLGDNILVSIVLSGQDLNNSIHRPERCLPAQGWIILHSSPLALPLPEGSRPASVPLTRLLNYRKDWNADHTSELTRHNLTYYTFVGASHITESHLRRTLQDIFDRIAHGSNQRWAYVTIASDITKDNVAFGKDEKQTDKMLQDFIAQLFPQISRF